MEMQIVSLLEKIEKLEAEIAVTEDKDKKEKLQEELEYLEDKMLDINLRLSNGY